MPLMHYAHAFKNMNDYDPTILTNLHPTYSVYILYYRKFIKIYTQIEYFNEPCANYLVSKIANLWLLLFHPYLTFSLPEEAQYLLCSIFQCVGLMISTVLGISQGTLVANGLVCLGVWDTSLNTLKFLCMKIESFLCFLCFLSGISLC